MLDKNLCKLKVLEILSEPSEKPYKRFYFDLNSLVIDYDNVNLEENIIPFTVDGISKDNSNLYPDSKYKIKRDVDLLDFFGKKILYLERKTKEMLNESDNQESIQKNLDLLDHLKRLYFDDSLDCTYKNFDPIAYHLQSKEFYGSGPFYNFHQECYKALQDITNDSKNN